ncbi:hypothetical protein EON66_05725, partial [archaeon]
MAVRMVVTPSPSNASMRHHPQATNPWPALCIASSHSCALPSTRVLDWHAGSSCHSASLVLDPNTTPAACCLLPA